MAENIIPATEAAVELEDESSSDEQNHYEFAFHLLPMVAESEVSKVFEELKAQITKAGGEIVAEEAPEHFELAYTIEQRVEGKYRHFTETFFGWVRFTLSPSALEALEEAVKGRDDVLRHMIVRLSRADIENPFKVFEKKEEPAIVESIRTSLKSDEKPAPAGEVSERELDRSLEEITS